MADGIASDVRLWRPPAGLEVRGILAAPPCTAFSVSGARWWARKGEAALLDGLSVVDACIRIIEAVRPAWWALENPVGRLRHYLGPARATFQPWQYGDPYQKLTCLWGTFIDARAVRADTAGAYRYAYTSGAPRARAGHASGR